ncbi:NADase-type glycan-binding domain-containing protein [Streptomyces sp. NPDC090075]|uniref:NADase-type glycan-binding domain-containing protein n=1 Tax=Streptomyces sp. NPDC090075 TaxID=3365937 RepID=UPI003803E581
MTTTQNCTECGTVAEPGQSFCDACGAVLSWTGNRDTPTPEPTPATAPNSGTAAPAWDAFTRRDGGSGLPQREVRATTTTAPREEQGDVPRQEPGDLSTPPTTAPLQGRGAESDVRLPPRERDQPPPAVTTPTAETTPLPQAAEGEDADDAHDRARRLLVPVQDPDATPPPAPSVAPVLPGRPTPQRPASVRTPGEDLGAHGGTPCPWCATPNRPDRHFCTRCAMPMAGHDSTSPSAPRPWWRRIFDFRNRETPWAGDRPRLRRTFDRVLTWIVAAVVLALVTVLAFNIPNAVSATRDHFAQRAQVSPDRITASRSYAGHKPDLAFDKVSNTWWGPGVIQGGEGEWIEARFDEPTRLLNVIVSSGESNHFDQLKKSALPHRVKVTIKTADGKTEDRELTLDQMVGGQTRNLRAADVVSVRFTIESSYQASAETQVAIAEIELFGPSSASSS